MLLFDIDQPVVAIVIVPADGTKLPLAPIARAPFTVKSDESVTVPFILSPANANVPEFEIAPPVIVIAPLDGERLAEVPTVRLCVIVNDEPVFTVAELAVAKS